MCVEAECGGVDGKKAIGNELNVLEIQKGEGEETMTLFSRQFESGVAVSNCLVFWRSKQLFEMSRKISGKRWNLVPNTNAHLWNKIRSSNSPTIWKISMQLKTLNPTRLMAFRYQFHAAKKKKHVRRKYNLRFLNRTHLKCKLSITIVHWKCKFFRYVWIV